MDTQVLDRWLLVVIIRGGNQRELFKLLNVTGQQEIKFSHYVLHDHVAPFSPHTIKVFQTVRTHTESGNSLSGGCQVN